MEKQRNRAHSKKSNTSYWQSYSDMMSALLLMFILIMALTLVRSLRMFEEKNADLERQQITIEQQQNEIFAQQQALASREDDLNAVKGELSNLSKLVSVKSDIITSLQQKFQKSGLSVLVDEKTGAITFDAGIFFSTGSAHISKEGAEFLKEFVPEYLSVLLNNEFRNAVSEIIIEGHTDTVGTYMYNLELSQDRAYSVATFCLNERNHVLTMDQLDTLRNILTANGRSYSDPVYGPDGSIDLNASRRVVFKFRLKDDEMVAAIQGILGEHKDD